MIHHSPKLNEQLRANLTLFGNYRMSKNEGSPMRGCCFESASICALKKRSIRKEANTKLKQNIHIASNFSLTSINFETILGFQIHKQTVQNSFSTCALAETPTSHQNEAAD